MSYGKKRSSRGNSSPKGGKDGSVVPKHEDGQVLSCSYLHQLEESIKTRTPIAGAGINIVKTDAGSTIQIAGGVLNINACSNGVPIVISVYGRVQAP